MGLCRKNGKKWYIKRLKCQSGNHNVKSEDGPIQQQAGDTVLQIMSQNNQVVRYRYHRLTPQMLPTVKEGQNAQTCTVEHLHQNVHDVDLT